MGVPVFDVGLPHELIGQTMKTTLDRRHALSPGKAPCGTHRTHHGFRAGVGKTHFVDLRTQSFDLLHHQGVKFGGKTRQGAAALNLRNHCFVNPLVAITQNDWPIAQTEIHIGFAVHIEQFATLGTLDEDGAVGAPVAVVFSHALGHVQHRFLQQLRLTAHGFNASPCGGRSNMPTRSSSNFTTCSSAASSP